jgi:ferric-dicitrate binding protein FerR (iron transport regulator)
MNEPTDIVESLIRSAGRRADPPADAYREVLMAATDAFRRKSARHRQGRWFAVAAAAATVVVAALQVARWDAPTRGDALATVERMAGVVELAQGEAWLPLEGHRGSLGTGRRLRTRSDGRVALALAGGASLRLAGDTEILLDAHRRLFVQQGTIYVDGGTGADAERLEVVTPAGTARDIGTQFELQVAGARLRLRVREGSVSIERGGRSHLGSAGEQITIDDFGGVERGSIAPSADAWAWAEALAPLPDMDGRPAAQLISWVARETGRRLRYESPAVEERAAAVILHGNIRHLPPLAALEAMLATTDLEYALEGDTIEVRARGSPVPEP